MAGRDWVITVVDRNVVWRRATAAALVREAGASPQVAADWSRVRRQMSPAGLKRKLSEQRN